MELSSRLKLVLNHYKLTATAFADKVGVPRSSISHIMSGRNKPSLDFVTKVISAFPEVNLYWLLNGKGSFPDQKNSSPSKLDDHDQKPSAPKESRPLKKTKNHHDQHKSNSIEKIIIFYQDGSFETYHPKL